MKYLKGVCIHCILTFTICLEFSQLYAQGEIPVDMYTGQPSIAVPIGTLSSNDISVPVSLSYDINSANNKGLYGYGWNLSAGGSVSREVRGLPDDFGYDDLRKGWLYNTGSGSSTALITASFPASPDPVSTLASEYDANDFLTSLQYKVDTEPDIFSYNCGGVSGSFVYDNNLVIRTIPYRDVKIEPTHVSASDRKLLSFRITTNDGYAYTFSEICTATRRTEKNIYLLHAYFLTTDYEFYKETVAYTTEWKLTRIDSPTGAFVTLQHNELTNVVQNISDVNVGYYKYLDPIVANATDIEIRKIYDIREGSVKRHLTNITGSTGQTIQFIYNGQLSKIEISDSRRGSTPAEKLIKTTTLRYNKVNFLHSNYYFAYSKMFLTSVTDSHACESFPAKAAKTISCTTKEIS